jgi:threonine dehydratase
VSSPVTAYATMDRMAAARTVRMPVDADLMLAERVVRRMLTVSPVVAAPGLGDGVVLKLETLQPTGSFKVRGGIVALSQVAGEGARVVAASAGNHGLGVAFAAAQFGVPATIVVPETASAKKIRALEELDVTLVKYGADYDEAEAHGLALVAADPTLQFVSPYNDPLTIAGQATIAFELLDQLPELATVVVPIGGGGLISGVALGLAARERQDVNVIGVVAAASPAMAKAYEVGHTEPVLVEPTLADGLAGNLETDTITVAITREHVDTIVEVDEDEIAAAMRYLAFEHGVVSEGSGAVGVGALQSGRITSSDRGTTAVLITGRNVAAATLAVVLSG